LIEEHVNAVLNPIKSAKQQDPSWLRPFTDLGDDPTIQKLRDEVNTEVRLTMVQQFGRRSGGSKESTILSSSTTAAIQVPARSTACSAIHWRAVSNSIPISTGKCCVSGCFGLLWVPRP